MEDDESNIAESESIAADDVSVTSHDPSESSHDQEIEISDSDSDQENEIKTDQNCDTEKSTKHSDSGASAEKVETETSQELTANQNTENDLEVSGACKSEKSDSIGLDNVCDSNAVIGSEKQEMEVKDSGSSDEGESLFPDTSIQLQHVKGDK